MLRVWQGLREGWREARWSLTFGLIFLPLALVSTFLGAALDSAAGTPGTWTRTLLALCGIASFLMAALRDGPFGQIGPVVWYPLLVLLILALLRRLKQQRETEEPIPFRFAGYDFVIRRVEDAAVRTALRPIRIRDIRHLQLQQQSGDRFCVGV